MKDIVKIVDPSLEFLEKLKPSSLVVYKVRSNNNNYVLKIAKEHSCDIFEEHILREKKILDCAKDTKGVTHLIKYYDNIEGYGCAILKEYFEGKTLLEINKKIKSNSLRKQLEKTVCDLHSLNIANLDIAPRNIVISPDNKKVKLIDFGIGLIYSENSNFLSLSDFNKLKIKDLNNLEFLF